ncbi:IS1595 family transposase [Polaromonas sp. DSP2-3-2b2]|uniref:IS1595 family transposase n=1 Tax=Polaromonas sp. DSP2-3-2b2 TaxID=2804662 RepID=UPI003CF427CC
MIQKNRYFRHSKISEAKFRQVMRYFAMDLTATDCAELSGVSVRSVNTIYLRVRRRLAEHCEQVSPLGGELEADESYFGPRRVRGLRGRGAGGKTVVFGLLKRGQNVYTEIVPNASKAVLQAIIRGKADIASVIHTDRWRGYDGLVDVGFDKHLRVNHGNNEFARGSVHVNGIESFWSYAKRRLVQFNGVPRHTFYLHLKETEYRFNHRHQSLYHALLALLRSNPL